MHRADDLGEKIEQEDTQNLPKREFKYYDEKLITEVEEEERQRIAAEKEREEWVDLLGSGDLMKKVIKPGTAERPVLGDRTTICYTVKHKDKIVEHKEDFTFILGESEAPQALDLGVGLMDEGEVALIKAAPRFAYGEHGKKPDIPGNADVEFEVELLSHEHLTDHKDMSLTEKIQYMNHKRLVGNQFYQEENFEAAANCYVKAVKCSNEGAPSTDNSELLQEFNTLKIKCLNNLTTCQIKIRDYQEALKNCNQTLDIEPENAKALYKKGKILSSMSEYDQAIECLTKSARLEPNDPTIRDELSKAKQKRIEYQKKEKSLFSTMISSFESPPPISDSLSSTELNTHKTPSTSKESLSDSSTASSLNDETLDPETRAIKKTFKELQTKKPPPFYETYIFRIIVVSILLGFVAIFFRQSGISLYFDSLSSDPPTSSPGNRGPILNS